jgi:endo-alpha-1,4-polygalactosaminidase (GH114 family)
VNKQEQNKAKTIKEKQREHLLEIQKSCAEIIDRKHAERARQRDEDIRIIQFLIEKARVEEEKEKEEKRKKAERETELARVHALQKKVYIVNYSVNGT